MLSDYRCFFCFTRAFERLLVKENISMDARMQFTHEMARLYSQYKDDFSAPVFSRELHSILKSYSGNPDPYREAKKKNNDTALHLYPDLRKKVDQSDDPFDMALRLAIAGNIMDFAANVSFDIQATIDQVLHSDYAIDHSQQLKKAAKDAKTVLYLGDNAGEIVFDKLFIETMSHPDLYFAVRGAPIINDATMEDALYVGMPAKVISNGYDAPSTILEQCSVEFKEIFNRADLIISKGQGNLEGLFGKKDKDIFYLLMAKCNVIADALGVAKGGFVVVHNKIIHENSCCQR